MQNSAVSMKGVHQTWLELNTYKLIRTNQHNAQMHTLLISLSVYLSLSLYIYIYIFIYISDKLHPKEVTRTRSPCETISIIKDKRT